MLRAVGRGLRQIFRRKVVGNQLPLGHGHRAQILAEHLSKVEGASLIWCSLDGELLTPISTPMIAASR